MEGQQVALPQEVVLPKPVESAMALKGDLPVELGNDNQEVLNEVAQQSQLYLLPSLCSRALPMKATQDMQGSSCQWHPEAMHDAVLKNQETLHKVLTNQAMLKNLVDRLQNTMSSIEDNQATLKNFVDHLQNTVSSIEDRVQAIEQEMSIFAQFSKEIDQIGDETNFDEIAFYP